VKSLVPQILYTEDDADTRELISFVLTKSNCKVVLADNNEKALLLARNNHFDLYMIDNWMPDMIARRPSGQLTCVSEDSQKTSV
jgi:DNA-binding response OmpR family regulator